MVLGTRKFTTAQRPSRLAMTWGLRKELEQEDAIGGKEKGIKLELEQIVRKKNKRIRKRRNYAGSGKTRPTT
jgi:hypothetical protein